MLAMKSSVEKSTALSHVNANNKCHPCNLPLLTECTAYHFAPQPKIQKQQTHSFFKY